LVPSVVPAPGRFLDDDALAKADRQLLSDQTAEGVRRRARTKRRNDPDGLCGKSLGGIAGMNSKGQNTGSYKR